MSSVLVVYGTGTGCTKEVAERIGETVAGKGLSVDVRSASDKPDPTGYDAVFVGSGVRAGQWHQSVRTWVTANAAALKTRPVAFYTVCLTMADGPEKAVEVRAYTDALIAETGVEPLDYGLFAGWNQKYGLVERTILKVMKAPQGDFRDFDAIARWATAAAPKLGLAG